MLILISTPIGNLADISERALDALKTSDLILCEDTRHSGILLHHYGIKRPLQSFHQFNEKKQEDKLIEKLQTGATITLISDAGTPAFCDPGQKLVDRCHNEKIVVSAIPGPCAVTMALSLSGFEIPPFQFGGFLPKKQGELKTTLLRALFYPGVTCFYDTPYHIEDTLAALKDLAPERRLCIAREMTKKHEEILRGKASELKPTLKGEFCLIIDRGPPPPEDLKALVSRLQKTFDLSEKSAIKIAAEIAHVSKQDLYSSYQS